MGRERREYTRLDVALKVRYRVLESLGSHKQTVTQDMSEKGIRIPVSGKLEPGTRLEIAVSIPHDPEPIHAIGRVVWIKTHPETNEHETGIHLVHIKQSDVEKLYKFAVY